MELIIEKIKLTTNNSLRAQVKKSQSSKKKSLRAEAEEDLENSRVIQKWKLRRVVRMKMKRSLRKRVKMKDNGITSAMCARKEET